MSHDGGSRARAPLTAVQQALAAENVGFVERIARAAGRRFGRLLLSDDAASVGQMAQVEATRDFDPARGDFATYASWRVRGAVANAAKKEVSHAQALVFGAYAAVCEHLADASDPCDVWRDTEADFRQQSDAFSGGVLAGAFASVVGAVLRGAGEEGHAQRELYQRAVEALREASSELSERDQELLYMHYGEELDLKEIAKRKGLGYSTVRRHHAEALSRLAVKLSKRGIRSATDAGLER